MKIEHVTQFTFHAQQRAAQRGISETQLTEALLYGDAVLKGGRLYTFFHTIVCVEANGQLVTAYRDKRGRRQIAKKPRYAAC